MGKSFLSSPWEARSTFSFLWPHGWRCGQLPSAQSHGGFLDTWSRGFPWPGGGARGLRGMKSQPPGGPRVRNPDPLRMKEKWGAGQAAPHHVTQASLRSALRWDVRCRGSRCPVKEGTEGRCISSAEGPGKPRWEHPWGRRLCLQNG